VQAGKAVGQDKRTDLSTDQAAQAVLFGQRSGKN